MNKNEFLGKLQLTYIGDRNAFEEIVNEYDRLNNIISELEKWLKEYSEKDTMSSIIFGVCLEHLHELMEKDND